MIRRSPSTSLPAPRSGRFGRRVMWRALLGLAVIGAAVAWAPARWMWRRVQDDREVLGVKRPDLSVGAGERVLVVSPHLDDETLGAGGILAHLSARKIPVRVVFLSSGDGSGSTILALNFSHGRRFSFVESARVRQREALAALQKLGVPSRDVAFLGYPDGDLQTMWDSWDSNAPVQSRFTLLSRVPYKDAPGFNSEFRGRNLLRDLAREMREFRPTRVLSTHGADTHPDHWSADAFARLALQVLEARADAPPIEHDGFLIHHGVFPLPHGQHLDQKLGVPAPLANLGTRWRDFSLSAREQKSKQAALEEYKSQLRWTPHYLRAFVRRNEPLGEAPNFLHAASWRDEAEESWALARNPGADVRAVAVQNKASGKASGVEIEVALGGPLPANTTCVVNVKSVFKSGRVVAQRLEARAIGSSELRRLRVLAQSKPGQRPRSVVIDASTWSGAPESGALDRTEARAVRLD